MGYKKTIDTNTHRQLYFLLRHKKTNSIDYSSKFNITKIPLFRAVVERKTPTITKMILVEYLKGII